MYRYKLSFLVALFLLILACGEQNEVRPLPNDFKINESNRVQLGALTIYPITKKSNDKTEYLTLEELKEEKGVNLKNSIPDHQPYYETFILANKTAKKAILPYGNLFMTSTNSYTFSEEFCLIKAKQITPIRYQTIIQGSYNKKLSQNKEQLPILMCPPAPLYYMLTGKQKQAEKWLREALPLLDFHVNEHNNTLQIDFFGNRQDDEDSDINKIPMKGLRSLVEFKKHFSRIKEVPNVCGYLIEYQGKIIQAFVLDNSTFFRKEWPSLMQSIYLNQLMGYSTVEFNNLRTFTTLQSAEAHTKKLWTKEKVFSKDKAYRGDIEEKPFQLIWQ